MFLTSSLRNLQVNTIAQTLFLWLIWGYNYVSIKQALEYSGIFDFAALRTLIGSGCLVTYLFITNSFRIPKDILLVFLLGLLQTSAFVIFSCLALSHGKAGNTAVLTFTMPFWVIILSRIFFKEKLNNWQIVATTICFLGIFFIFQIWHHQNNIYSDLYALSAGISLALATILAKKNNQAGRNGFLLVVTWQMLLGSLPLIILALLIPQKHTQWTIDYVGYLMFSAIPANAFAWVVWFYLLSKLPASIASLNILAIPAFSMLAVWFQFNEIPNITEFLGIVLVIIGLSMLISGNFINRKKPNVVYPQSQIKFHSNSRKFFHSRS